MMAPVQRIERRAAIEIQVDRPPIAARSCARPGPVSRCRKTGTSRIFHSAIEARIDGVTLQREPGKDAKRVVVRSVVAESIVIPAGTVELRIERVLQSDAHVEARS
jgi:hypothetical protein